MRARRKRFTVPRIRTSRDKTTRTLEGVTRYRNSNAGRYAKLERLWVQCEKQQAICPLCGGHLDIAKSKFESREFKDGVENRVIHRKCPV